MDQYVGKMLDNRYELLELIGSGGMANVYKTKCHRLNRLVAVKILKSDLAQNADFRRRLVAQDGTVINDGSRSLTPEELLHMDWLCENVEGSIPAFDTLLPYAQPTVRELGIYRDSIPMEKEGSL